MKKIALALLIFILSVSLFSCERPDTSPKYELTVIDEGNFIYDKASLSKTYASGTVLKFHAHVLTDVDLAMYVNGEFKSIQTGVQTQNGDIWEYVFEMPKCDAVIKFEIAPESVYLVYSLYPLAAELNEETLKGVRVEKGYIGVDPESSKPTINYSEDSRDIANNLSIIREIESINLYEYDYYICGGWYRKIKYFMTENREFELCICNGYLFVNDGDKATYYRFENMPSAYPDALYGDTVQAETD